MRLLKRLLIARLYVKMFIGIGNIESSKEMNITGSGVRAESRGNSKEIISPVQ